MDAPAGEHQGTAAGGRMVSLDAFRGLTFDTPTSTITLREDGQGLEDQLVGLSSHGDRFPFAVPRDMVIFPAAMVSTPVGQKSVDWLKSLKPDMLAQVPAPITAQARTSPASASAPRNSPRATPAASRAAMRSAVVI